MAKTTKKKGSGENVAAALDQLEAHHLNGPKQVSTVRSRLKEQDEIIDELQDELATADATKKAELQAQATAYEKKVADLTIKLEKAEATIKRVQVTLN